MKRLFCSLLLLCIVHLLLAQSDQLLEGTPIGSSSFGLKNAFDDNFNTYYKASDSSLGWVGLDLGTDSLGQDRRCVVTRVAWVSRLGGYAELGVFEGANTSTFEDAVPLYMTPESGSGDQWNEVEIHVSRAFRYLRYVGPHDQYCRITELRFYGYEAEGSDSLFYQPTNLPVVSIHTTSGKDPTNRTTDVPATVQVVRHEGTKEFDMGCTVRYRGNGSYTMPKKGYRIKLAEKHKMAGSPAKAKKWVLIPSYGDKTLMRNILAFDVSRRMEMAYTPFCQPVDVFVNGEYKGNYELCDQLTVGKDRVNITEIKKEEPINNETLSGGYLFEIDANFSSSSGDVGFKTAKASKSITIKSPNDTVLTYQHKNWLKKYFDEMEKYIYNKNYTDQGYSRFLDFESFVRYFLINEYCSNTDAYWEMYLYKDRGDSLIYSGPIWDMDLGFDNDNRTHYCLWKAYWLYSMDTYYGGWNYQGSSCYSDMRTVIGYIVNDPRIKQRLAEVWAYYRASGVMNTEALQEVLEEQRELLYQSQALNFKRWDILGSQVHQNYQALGTYDKEVDYVKNFLGKRIDWMDKRASISAADLTITIPDSHWTTLYLPTAFSAPEGTMLYEVHAADVETEQSLRLDTVWVAEANRPYLLYGEPGSYTLAKNDARSFDVTATDNQSLGLLTGTRFGLTAPYGSYLLQTDADGQVGFQQVTSGNRSVAAKSAYLTLANAPSFLPLDQTQGIQEITPDNELAANATLHIYSPSGQLILSLPDGDYTPTDLRQHLSPGLYLLQRSSSSEAVKVWVK